MDGDLIVLNCTVSALSTTEFVVENSALRGIRNQYGEYKLQQTFTNILWTKDNKLIEFDDKLSKLNFYI